MKRAAAIAGLFISVSFAGAADAKPARVPVRGAPAHSLGSPSSGKLVGGKRIERSKALRVVGSLQFALPSLVDMLERSANTVAKRFPGSVLTVGDLSAKEGGEVSGHRSHESGRDADVGFYLKKGNASFMPGRFAAIAEDGKVVGIPGARFDDERNWALVQAWLNDSEGRVLQIFVAKHVRARLLAQAERSGASAALRTRAAEVLMQPSHALPHDNHFHVRVACPTGDKTCVNFEKPKARKVAAIHKRPRKLARR